MSAVRIVRRCTEPAEVKSFSLLSHAGSAHAVRPATRNEFCCSLIGSMKKFSQRYPTVSGSSLYPSACGSTSDTTANCCWKHSGFSVDNSVRIAKGDKTGMQRLVQYIARCPFSLTRMVSITKDGKILYRASHAQCIPFPLSGDETLMKGLPRNYELYDQLDFLAEVTQHIPKPQMTQKKQWRSH